MSGKKDICAVCAWRADCKKKFSVSGRDMRCPDFVRDRTLPEDKEEAGVVDFKQKESGTKS